MQTKSDVNLFINEAKPLAESLGFKLNVAYSNFELSKSYWSRPAVFENVRELMQFLEGYQLGRRSIEKEAEIAKGAKIETSKP